MHSGLAESLEHLCEQSEGAVDFDRPALERLCALLRDGVRFPPSTFALYYDLVPALEDGDRRQAELLFAGLAEERRAAAGISVHAIGEGSASHHAERYRRMMDAGQQLGFEFSSPSPALASEFEARFREAMDVLDSGVPELADEIRAIISEVVIVSDDEFDGGSSYMLWGALFLSAALERSDVELIEVIAHESAHSLLFGLCTDEALVNNDDEELYPSPLREDPRPMDGVFHATFVSARIHWVLTKLLEREVLEPQKAAAALEARERDRANFEDGYGVVARHGDLTETGRAVMAGARAYMDSIPA